MNSDKFLIVPVNSLRDALRMKNIRNQVRLYMTHNTDEITTLEQIIWYFKYYKKSDTIRGYLVMNGPDFNVPIGYGLVTNRGDEWNVTGAILEDYRGLGIGRTLFRFLTQSALLNSGKDVYLDVRSENLPAISLYLSLGYKPIAVDERRQLVKMKWSGEITSE